MTSPSQSLPAVARGVAIGLLLMAVFTVWWTSDSFVGWPIPAAIVTTAVGIVAALIFVVQSVRLFLLGRRDPATPTPQDRALGRRTGRVFGILFGAEAVVIFVVLAVLGSTGLDDYALPAIAVVVGLHFYPMARLFRRSVDVWLATWTTLVGIAGVIAVAIDDDKTELVWSWVGAGVAVATVAYGLYMFRVGSRLLRQAV